MPVNGDSVVITGSGFGTRSVIEETVDRCTGTDPNDLWEDTDASQGTAAFAYSSGFHSVPMPHSRTTKYAIAQILDSNVGNAWLTRTPDWAGGTKTFYFAAWKRFDPSWPFNPSCDGVPSGDTDNNLKHLAIATGVGPFTGNDWYENASPQKCTLIDPIKVHAETTDGLGTIDIFGTDYGGVSAQSEDPFYNWVKVEYLVTLSATVGTVVLRINNSSKLNASGLNNDDQPGTSRTVSFGCYARSRDGANNYIYLSDIVCLATTSTDNAKRVMLANNATFGSATITEYCPTTAWADGSITATLYQGAIPTGNAWLHVLNGMTVLGTQAVTITAGGGSVSTGGSAPIGFAGIGREGI